MTLIHDDSTRREQLRTIVEQLYGNNRSELARDLKVSPSQITMMMSGERVVTEKFILRLMRAMPDLLNKKAAAVYRSRRVAIQLGRSVFPGFDLPHAVSNADYEIATE